jgi:hypothetical protein
MPFKTYDNLEAVPADERDVYEEREDPATPGVKRAHPKLPDVTKLQSALDAERTTAKEADRLRKAAEKERDDLKRTQKAKEDGISEEELQRQRDAEAALRKPLEDENATLKTKLRKVLVQDKAKQLFIEHGGNPKSADRAIRDLEAQGRLDLSDAEALVIKDAKGVVTTEDPVHFFKETYAAEAEEFYLAEGGSGGGARPSTTTAAGDSKKAVTVESVAESKRASGAFSL